MPSFNEPTGWNEANTANDWTPARGLARGAGHAMIAVVPLVLLTGLVARFAPPILLDMYLRCASGFFITLILLVVIQRAAGMTGWPCTALAILGTLVVLLSHHVVWAISGVPTTHGPIGGLAWLAPMTLLVTNWLAGLGITFAAALGHNGSAIGDVLVDVLLSNPLTGARH